MKTFFMVFYVFCIFLIPYDGFWFFSTIFHQEYIIHHLYIVPFLCLLNGLPLTSHEILMVCICVCAVKIILTMQFKTDFQVRKFLCGKNVVNKIRELMVGLRKKITTQQNRKTQFHHTTNHSVLLSNRKIKFHFQSFLLLNNFSMCPVV